MSGDVPDPTQRFSSRVENYVRFRPSYPRAVIETLAAESGLTPSTHVADIGSGTGKLTELFLDHGNSVVAVEPNREMREAGEAALSGHAPFRSVDGRAEATNLPDACVDLAIAGQAFHWFDRHAARKEFLRILRPPFSCALVWNDRHTSASRFMTEYEAFLGAFGTDYERVNHQTIGDDEIAAFFGRSGCRTGRFPYRQVLDLEGLTGRLLSSSYMPDATHPRYDAMIAELGELFARHASEDRVSFDYQTRLYHGSLS